MDLENLQQFASELALAGITALVTPGKFGHRMRINNVDYFFSAGAELPYEGYGRHTGLDDVMPTEPPHG